MVAVAASSELRRDVGQLLWVGFRGSTAPDYLLRLIGRRRIGFVFAAAATRQTAKEPAPGGKGGVFGSPEVTVYREDAWHLLCVGPAFCLWRIEQNGNVLFDTGLQGGAGVFKLSVRSWREFQ